MKHTLNETAKKFIYTWYNVEVLYIVKVAPIGIITLTEVESIGVFEEAATTSIYGSRVGNVAILIPIKNGNSGRLRVILNLHCWKVKECPAIFRTRPAGIKTK